MNDNTLQEPRVQRTCLELTTAPGMHAMAFAHVPWQVPIEDDDSVVIVHCPTLIVGQSRTDLENSYVEEFDRVIIVPSDEEVIRTETATNNSIPQRVNKTKHAFENEYGPGFRFRLLITRREWGRVRLDPMFLAAANGYATFPGANLLAQWLDLDAVLVIGDGLPNPPPTPLELAAASELRAMVDRAAEAKGVDRNQRWTWNCGDAITRRNLTRAAEFIGVTIAEGQGDGRTPTPSESQP